MSDPWKSKTVKSEVPSEDALKKQLEEGDLFKNPIFEEQRKFFAGIFDDAPFMKMGPTDEEE